MRIAIKAAQIAEGGGLTHLNKIIEWFGVIAREHDFLLVGRSGQEKLFIDPPRNFRYMFNRLPAVNLATQIWWERRILPGLLEKTRCDLLFEPGNRGTLESPCPKVSLIHNMAPFYDDYLRDETPYQKLRQSFLKKATFDSLEAADGIIFISKHSRDYFERHLNLNRKARTVIYHGRLEGSTGEDTDSVLRKHGISNPFVLCVSNIWRYKKILEMVKSYIRCAGKNNNFPTLVIVGHDYSPEYTTQVKKLIHEASYQNKIVFTGLVKEQDLAALYRKCRAFLFPSAIEACPNILIEAMSMGCAIACSNRGVMPEITDGSALYFDPDDIDDFAAKIQAITLDNSLNQYLRTRALNRAEYFSWEKTARQTLAFLLEVYANIRCPEQMQMVEA